ncbi:hypothetical protein MBRA_06321 [Methylobacterium brachiatum]|nr:hypothetical protein MBRA_06321 [Methylobacterium brachiatum]
MDPRNVSSRLHDILRTACRVRLPGPGCTAEAAVCCIDQVKAQLRALIEDIGNSEPPRLPPRLHATATAFPEGRIAGTRITVQYRRRTRVESAGSLDQANAPAETRGALILMPERPSPRDVAEAQFARLSKVTAELALSDNRTSGSLDVRSTGCTDSRVAGLLAKRPSGWLESRLAARPSFRPARGLARRITGGAGCASR